MQSRSTHRAGTLKLIATSEFGNTRRMAGKRIYELVNSKIDDFLDIADYDWYDPSRFGWITRILGCRLLRMPIPAHTWRMLFHS